MDIEKQLLAIERKLWTNDAILYEDSLIQEALLVFAETGVISRDFAVDAIRKENAEGRRWAEVDIKDARTLRISDDAYVLSYRVTARWEHEESKYSALASSVYVSRGEAWKLAFHQQTTVEAS